MSKLCRVRFELLRHRLFLDLFRRTRTPNSRSQSATKNEEVFKQLQLLTLPCLYILETTLFCVSKCALTRGQDIHMYETRGRANYRTGRHRTVVYERLPSQAGVHFLNRLPNSIKHAPTPKALKTRLKRFLVSQAFYNAGEFFAFDWETAQLED
ncbi:hypothetical protein J6590_050666 [Homalodisca vitripennis]|nr:hypothetical protein J6590_050666 [Homalodisca vitripennis]